VGPRTGVPGVEVREGLLGGVLSTLFVILLLGAIISTSGGNLLFVRDLSLPLFGCSATGTLLDKIYPSSPVFFIALITAFSDVLVCLVNSENLASLFCIVGYA